MLFGMVALLESLRNTFGNVPFMAQDLACLLPQTDVLHKVSQMERAGYLVRLKKGLYVLPSHVSRCTIQPELLANHIYHPSYVSLQWALRYYGLIPERVSTVTSVCTARSATIQNALGTFTYTTIPSTYFPVGIRQVQENGVTFLMASPEKALTDLIVTTKGLNLRYRKEMAAYLYEDLRLEPEAVAAMDTELIAAIAQHSKKKSILQLLINAISHEQSL